jgi:hypothetical protein
LVIFHLNTKNSDALISYLEQNDVSLYCPYPLEDYPEGNRLPAISFHPIDNDSVNIGFLVQSDGHFREVLVSESFSEIHPVWILMPYEDNKSQKTISKESKIANNVTSYEVSVVSVYCKQYFGGIFDGSLDMRIIRANPGSLSFIPASNTYTGGIETDISFKLPRSYVRNAKKNYWSGWFEVEAVWHSDWQITDYSNIMYIYEWDAKGEEKKSIPINTYDSAGNVVANLGTLEYKAQTQDAIIGLQQWSRNWLFNIVEYGNPNWPWVHSSGNQYAMINGNYMIRISPDFYMTMRIREY